MANSKQYDLLNLIESDTVEAFLGALREGRPEDALRMVESEKIIILDEAYGQKQATYVQRLTENGTTYEQSLQKVKGERDVLLRGIAHIYRTTAFIFDSVKEHETAPISKFVPAMTKLFRVFGFKQLDERTVNTIGNIIFRVKAQLPQLQQDAPKMIEEVSPALDILNEYKIIVSPSLQVEPENDKK